MDLVFRRDGRPQTVQESDCLQLWGGGQRMWILAVGSRLGQLPPSASAFSETKSPFDTTKDVVVASGQAVKLNEKGQEAPGPT